MNLIWWIYIMKVNSRKFNLTIVICILGFILINSMFDGAISVWISSLPKRFVQLFIPYGTFKWLDRFLILYIRKFAHFFEYLIFSLLVTKLYFYKKRTLQRLVNTAFIWFSIGFLDETIQLFSGRKSKISDVWIDLFGACVGFLIYMAFKKIKERFTTK